MANKPIPVIDVRNALAAAAEAQDWSNRAIVTHGAEANHFVITTVAGNRITGGRGSMTVQRRFHVVIVAED